MSAPTTTLALSTDYSSSSSNNNKYTKINTFRYANNINMHMHKYKKTIMDDSMVHIGSASTSCSSLASPQLIKSNSYSGTSTRYPLEANGSCCDMDASECIPATAVDGDSCAEIANEESSELDAFLINPASSASNRRYQSRSSCSSCLRRNSCWLRAHAFIMRNWYLSYLVPIGLLGIIVIAGYLTRNYAKELLFWIETQNRWLIFVIFMALFTLVSFPIVVGYLVLLITAGYLFGCWRGWLTVLLGANVGIAIAHATIRSCRHRIAVHKLIKNETGRAILRVISGPKAFRVVLFTRLTPIPFGLQNVIFGISSIKARDYHLATFLGLLPAQTINVYLGSTLRSMHEVLNDHNTKLTGYISFVIEVICGLALMFWVVHKARKELSETLLSSEYINDGKPIDIQV
ncbi:transmembrane protein 64 [Drosophila novamexicana]|uniref:transmembrane protein 64 n=1 Tax=Drosophila novamexicana TaxID=47314 RepID=UPI0011E5BD24|nr:transmembrane protein 64 [Drosophila novamexicana]XP_030572964.1 transmembrane protein 64 [Drosophila novamexicana]XP_030572965.1 transmembrane protein 64 [Drosophila novamexicana]